jgi:hypothetical protein
MLSRTQNAAKRIARAHGSGEYLQVCGTRRACVMRVRAWRYAMRLESGLAALGGKERRAVAMWLGEDHQIILGHRERLWKVFRKKKDQWSA